MALVELSMLEQRYLAVREVLDTGATVTDVAARHGVDRRTLHRWLVRYANEGIGSLAEKSSKPDRCPHQLSPVIEARIIAMRTTHPGWGPRTILSKLRKEFDEVPSRSGIYRCLVRHKLIDPKARRRQRKDYKRWERSRSMELWQMDVVGRIYLTDGSSLSAVTGIDDHSRFCVIAKLVVRATARPVCDALLEGFSRHGIPEQILTDNGRVFTAKASSPTSQVLFDRICHNNGVKHILTAPYSPTTTGKIERLHRTMRKEFFDLHTFDTVEATQSALDDWVVSYNTEREHQSIGDVPPLRRFELAAKTPTAPFEVIDGDVGDRPTPAIRSVTRIVDSGGRISVLTFRYHVGKHLAGCAVEVHNSNGLLQVFHNGVLVATHAKRHLDDDDARFEGRPKALRPAAPTMGNEVFRSVDNSGAVSFAGTGYRAGNRYKAKRPASGSWATQCRSPSTASSSAPTAPATTGPRSSEPWPSPLARQGVAAMVSHSYRSQSGTRVPNLDTPGRTPEVRSRSTSNSRQIARKRHVPVAILRHLPRRVFRPTRGATRATTGQAHRRRGPTTSEGPRPHGP
jgi:transposase InsO family protein